MSRRQQILEASVARLAVIQRGNGYATDAGDAIQLGEFTELGPDDPAEAIAVVPGEDVTRTQGDKHGITLPLEIQAIARVDLDEPHAAAEAVLADIKRAYEQADRTLGGLLEGKGIRRLVTRTLPREAGMTTVGVGVTYLLDFQETWGDP